MYSKKFPISRDTIVLLLLSGLAIHDFMATGSLKVGFISLTYLRVILVITIPFLLWPQIKLHRHDIAGRILGLFLIYGLFRIGGNIKIAFNLYCTLIAFFILYISIANEVQLKKSIGLLAAIMIMFCIVGLFELISGHHFGETMDMMNYHGAVGMYYNVNDFSAFLTVFIFFLLLSDFDSEIKVLFVAMALIIIVCNRSVACLLGLISYVPVMYVLKTKKNRAFRIIVVGLVSLFMILPVILLIRSSSQVTRAYMYKIGVKNCMMHWAFGNGIGNYGKGMYEAEQTYHSPTDPHNLFLELPGQFGIIWAILLFVLLVKLLIFFGKRFERKESIYMFGLIYIIPFVGLSSSTCMEKNYIYLALLIPLIYYRSHSFDLEKYISVRMNGLQYMVSLLGKSKKTDGG